jgi:hypothetical protein
MPNHAFTHQRSKYCWKLVLIDVAYIRSKHSPLQNKDKIVSIKKTALEGMPQIILYKVFEC